MTIFVKKITRKKKPNFFSVALEALKLKLDLEHGNGQSEFKFWTMILIFEGAGFFLRIPIFFSGFSSQSRPETKNLMKISNFPNFH